MSCEECKRLEALGYVDGCADVCGG
jgi:hypothetical protein